MWEKAWICRYTHTHTHTHTHTNMMGTKYRSRTTSAQNTEKGQNFTRLWKNMQYHLIKFSFTLLSLNFAG